MIAYILLPLFSIVTSYITFKVIEAIHELRRCKEDCPSGGYYQTWSLPEYLAARYLRAHFEISVEKLPQGGYNVYPFDWKREDVL